MKRVVIEKAHMLLWAPGVRPSDPLCLTRMTRWPQCGTTSMPSNNGDEKSMAAACADPMQILDGMSPHVWQGTTAVAGPR